MAIYSSTLPEDYWDNYFIQEKDIDYLYNFLLEVEIPQTPLELINALVHERISVERKEIEKNSLSGGTIYRPANSFSIGQEIVVPSLNWEKASVVAIRDGKNPEYAPFKVIEISLDNGEHHQLAAELTSHILNDLPLEKIQQDPKLDPDYVLKNYSDLLTDRLSESLENNPDIVRIAGKWFPRALLVDVNIGYLNLAEALLEMEAGGPLPTSAILEQIELPTDVNLKLTEFSLNLALQEDGRFDEVGPSGEVVWYLRRLEPNGVQTTPSFLKYTQVQYPHESIASIDALLKGTIYDELEPEFAPTGKVDETVVSLLFPHWRSGTLPLAGQLKNILPSAIESQRVRFSFCDANTGEKFPGWVNLKSHYIYGLIDWYKAQGAFPGTLITIKRGKDLGEVVIRVDKRKNSREWVRTALVGNDNKIVFAMLKQPVYTAYDERMVLAVPDPDAIDKLWEQRQFQKSSLEEIIIYIMRELTKLNPQGHIHGLELYTAINIIKRCPPGPIFNLLAEKSFASYLGDLYFRLEEETQENENG